MYNKKKTTDKPVGKSSGLNHSSSGKASEKHNFPKQNDSKKASDVCPVHNPMPKHHIEKYPQQFLKTQMSVLFTESAAAASIRVWLTKNSYL